MRRRAMCPRVVVPSVLLAATALTAHALPVATGTEMEPPTVAVTGSRSAGEATIRLDRLHPGDRVFWTGAACPRSDAAPASWVRAVGSGPQRWESVVHEEGAFELRAGGWSATADEVAILGVDHRLSDGSVLQTTVRIGPSPDGGFQRDVGSVVRLRHGVRLTLRPGATVAAAGIGRDAEGRVSLMVGDSRLPDLIGEAETVEPFVTGESMTALALATVTHENNQNVSYQNHDCSGPYYGSVIIVSDAPSGALVARTDISYRVYQSVDISRVRVAAFRGGTSGYAQTDFIYLYQGTSSGTTVLDRTASNLSTFNGETVNYLYLVGCCNSVNAADPGYLDWWSITLYYDSAPTPTLDLVADSVAVGPTSVAAGGSVAAVFSGHVAGTGSVDSFAIVFYLSVDTTVSAGDINLGGSYTAWASSAGDTFGLGSPGMSLTIPVATPPGTYYLLMRVDDGGAIAETNENNNVAWTTLTVAAAGTLPNIQAVSCSVLPTATSSGATVTFTSRGRNAGSVGAADFVWGIYLSTDPTITPGSDTPIMALDVPGGWNAGYDTGDVPRSVTLPGGLADGTYYLGIAFDSGNAVSETSEADNTCSAALTIGTGGGSATTWIVPAVAATQGLGGAHWLSQVAIANPTGTARSATLHYVARGTAWPGSVLGSPVAVPANGSAFVDDPVAALADTAGLLWVELDAAGPVVTSRTFNSLADGSSYGQGIPGIPLSAASSPAEVVVPLVRSQPGLFHTNLGLVQTSAGSFTVEVTIYSPGGTPLAVKSYPSSAGWMQVDDLFANMGIGGTSLESGWVRVRKTAGSPASWLVYASVVDDRTKDPTYVIGVPR